MRLSVQVRRALHVRCCTKRWELVPAWLEVQALLYLALLHVIQHLALLAALMHAVVMLLLLLLGQSSARAACGVGCR